MYRYTIYCTEEQTKKAFEQGAPIITISEPLYNHPTCGRDWVKVSVQGNSYSARIPTAEQMIGWLEDQVEIDYISTFRYNNGWDWSFSVYLSDNTKIDVCHFISRKEATLAAIDAALNYLSKNK